VVEQAEGDDDDTHVAWDDARYLHMLHDADGTELSSLRRFTQRLVNSNWLRVSCFLKKRFAPALRHRPLVLPNSASRTVAAVRYVRAWVKALVDTHPKWTTLSKVRLGLSAGINAVIRSREFFSGPHTFVPHVGNMRRRLNTRMLRSIYANITYDIYQPQMSRNAYIADVLGHKLFDETTSLNYLGVTISRPVRRLPLPALERLRNLETSMQELMQRVDVDALRALVSENKVEHRITRHLLTDVEQANEHTYVVAGNHAALLDTLARPAAAARAAPVRAAEYAFFTTGTRGDRNRRLVSVKRNTRKIKGRLQDKVANKADE
jgi:hypothetical protein